MIRTQIQLTEEQAARLKLVAGERGISMAALIREAVEAVVTGSERERRWQRARESVGAFSSGRRDLAGDHDRELAEIYAER